MLLYSGLTPQFILDTTRNAIAGRLAEAFERHFRYRPSQGEYRSWQNSLRSLATVIDHGGLHDHGIILEYQLPLSSKRLDAILTGRDAERDRAVVVELKQWDETKPGSADDLLQTWVGGARRDVLHPSVQVNQYRRYLQDMHSAFHSDADPVTLDACAFLHNYTPIEDDALFAEATTGVRKLAPVFTGGDSLRLAGHLAGKLAHGDGERVMRRIEENRFRPARKLLEHVGKVVKEEPAFVLLDEQLVVFEQVLAAVEAANADSRKHVFLVHGGPGTGKSVLAVNLLGELARKGVNVQHATGSKAFTGTLRKIVGTRAGQQFRYFNNFGQAAQNEIDVLLCDEAHRIRSTSNHRFTRPDRRSDRPQIQELIEAARVTVFFVDDQQVVRPNEIGTSGLIRQAAADNKCVLHESVLETQFRCAGSDAFVGWVDNTLEIRRTPHTLFDQGEESFEFNIIEGPEALEALIREKAAQGYSARIVAGYCWPWSKTLGDDGQLCNDIVIGGFQKPWNARPDMARLPAGVPKADYWAYDPGGIDQVGCIYTAQGFEFDYVGLIWGLDLRHDPQQGWVGNRAHCADATVCRSGNRFLDLLKNTYRVLLSRGMKGCYVHFLDPATEAFVRSRTERLGARPLPRAAEAPPVRQPAMTVEAPDLRPFVPVRLSKVQPWQNAIPLLDLKVAAGAFSDPQALEAHAVEWVSLPDHLRIAPGYFVAQVVGESMNKRVPNGAWALFSADVRGSKQGRIVLAQTSSLGDPEEGGRYTLKIYEARKVEGEEETVYEQVLLRPASTDRRFQPIEIDLSDDERPAIVAVLVAVLI